MRKIAVALALLSLLAIAGCFGEDKRGNKCTTDADCSWCDKDGDAFNGKCEGDEGEKACGHATLTNCKTKDPNLRCIMAEGHAVCAPGGQVPTDQD
jgi:hypothetical protein